MTVSAAVLGQRSRLRQARVERLRQRLLDDAAKRLDRGRNGLRGRGSEIAVSGDRAGSRSLSPRGDV